MLPINQQYLRRFAGYPVLSWTIDDWEQFYAMIKRQGSYYDLAREVDRYKRAAFDNQISILFDKAPIKLNLGGETEKTKLIATDKPIGIFDFSMASRGLYRVPEYYSQELANKYPERFKEFELPSGVVPNNLVKEDFSYGRKRYFFPDNGQEFECIIQQKGEAAVNQGVPNAKLKFATRNKKVYLTYKRNKGKVKYVEIYSLFYYTSLSGDVQFAIRHIPAMMVAEYLESIGVMTRIYMTRFVLLSRQPRKTQRKTADGHRLPMSDLGTRVDAPHLFIQPIIVKEFGQDFDKELGFMVSSSNYQGAYGELSQAAQEKELSKGYDLYGYPNWQQNDYWEGIERYRNKYRLYVERGIFKSKEVQPEAMLFFHDIAIKNFMERYVNITTDSVAEKTGETFIGQGQALVNVDINPFFNWWMRMSATNLKNKIEIINSTQLRKDLADIDVQLQKMLDEVQLIIKNIPDSFKIGGGKLYSDYLRNELLPEILRTYEINDVNGKYSFVNYITSITTEITTYAEGDYFPTPEDEKERREELVETVLNELQNF